MNHIGNIIKKHRNSLNLSRAKLAENICSEKYIYLIEKGERTPSAEVIRLFSNKLGADLFDFYRYVDCGDPVAVQGLLKNFRACNTKGDFEELKKRIDAAALLPDFGREPWRYELELNRLVYMAFGQRRYREAIFGTQSLIEKIAVKYRSEEFTLNSYILLSACLQITDDIAGAKEAFLKARAIVDSNAGYVDSYVQTVVSLAIAGLGLYYKSGELKSVIEEALRLIDYQAGKSVYERVYYPYFYAAFSSYKLGDNAGVADYLNKGVGWMMVMDRPADLRYISSCDVFPDLLSEDYMPKGMLLKFKERYRFLGA